MSLSLCRLVCSAGFQCGFPLLRGGDAGVSGRRGLGMVCARCSGPGT